LAEKVGTSTQYIGQIEQNKKFPSPEMLERIAEALEVDSPQLFSMETYSQDAIQRFKVDLKANLEKSIDDFIDKVKIVPETHLPPSNNLPKQKTPQLKKF